MEKGKVHPAKMKPEILGIVRKVHDLFAKKKLTLSTAESCTGGLISHYVTALPGASTFFIAGVVAYSADMKKSLLNVPSDLIAHHGVVSEETARAMAEGILSITDSDLSVSSTGNLGPDVLEGKEEGLVYLAATRREMTVSKEMSLKGGREENKEAVLLQRMWLC